MADDDFGFDEWPWAARALAGQGTDRLTDEERNVIHAYAHNGFQEINDALWGQIPMTPTLTRRVALIRSGLAKYPLPQTVRVTREAEGQVYGILDEESAAALIDEQFTHDGFMSTAGVAVPPRSMRHRDPVILDLLVPAGTPALRLGELSPVPLEREVLLIDARSYVVVGVRRDAPRNMWRIQAIVTGGGQ